MVETGVRYYSVHSELFVMANGTQPSTVCFNNSVSLLDQGQQGRRATAIIPNSAHRHPVFVTPVPTSVPQLQQHTAKVLLKVVSKVGKSHKMFTLRNLNPTVALSCDQLKNTIRAQLKKEIIVGDFDVGYVNGSNMVSVRTQADVAEVWSEVLAGKKVVLWCDGLKDGSKDNTTRGKKNPRTVDENTSDEETHQMSKSKKKKTSQENREERVQCTIEDLKEKHGSDFTPMQVRIWSEMISGGLHSSLDEPPISSMFLRAGKGNNSTKKKEDKNCLSEAFTQAAVAISSALSPRGPVNLGSGASPAKIIESRSKCYKQLHDLSSLKESGVLTDNEYFDEKEAVLGVLRKLKGE